MSEFNIGSEGFGVNFSNLDFGLCACGNNKGNINIFKIND